MASLVLTTLGGALGGALGGPLGFAAGQLGGSLAGSLIGSNGTASSSPRVTVGPRLTSLGGIASTEGAPIPRVFGRARVGGQMIWATRFLEHVTFSFEPGHGGKGGSTPQTPPKAEITYWYSANFAIGLCEGPIAFVRRVWADGQELDLTTVTMRVYTGTEDQAPDPLIAAKEWPGTVPAYRGLAYVVFEGLPIGPFGNRVPQMTFEVVRPVDGIGDMVRAVNLIPGGTEFGYGTSVHISIPGKGTTVAENRNQYFADTDWAGSLDALQALCPNLEAVALVVVWFGDDLRAGHCTVAPRVDNTFKTLTFPTIPQPIADWSVAGTSRPGARLTSFVDGSAAYGGTPSDASVIEAIRDLRARGLTVVFYPFVMMDIPPGNTLPDPWTGSASQPPFPWRGRITCDPAPDRSASPDGTTVAAAQISAFFSGIAGPLLAPSNYRAFVLHCASLAQSAGGVDAFLVGSELAALTRVRAAPGVYPAVDALVLLAADVKAQLGPGTKVSYGADWTEYGAHVRGGGSDVRFPLDVFWSSPNVDFVGVDVYWPLSDWRDGDHLDASLAPTIYDLPYLGSRITSGEAFDWYYADDADRASQLRRPITDGDYGKPWIFRQKDLANWWLNTHVERVGGVETNATAWLPGSKPIWITETGCPAVDRGTNSPNIFPDPKSSEGGIPPFSRGVRDDLIQARFIEAMLAHYDPQQQSFVAAHNPAGSSGGRMVDPSRIFLWAWDARPFPAFPALSTLWADSSDWQTGHWLNGRLEGMPLDRLLSALTADVALLGGARDRPDVEGFVDGYVLERPMSMRSAIEPLTAMFAFDPVATSGTVRFVSRARPTTMTLTEDVLVPNKTGALVETTRGQETELPHEIALLFGDADHEYAPASVLSRRIEGWSARQTQVDSAVMTNRGAAQRHADTLLDDLWVARETARFTVDPRLLAIEPGDIVAVANAGTTRLLRINEITDGSSRAIAARAIDPAIYDRTASDTDVPTGIAPPVFGPPHVLVLDLAVVRDDPVTLQYLAATATPWPGAINVYRSSGSSGGLTNEFVTTLPRKATVGETLDAMPPGPASRFDRGTKIRVKLLSGALASVSDSQALNGENTFAICGPDGAWEIFAASGAELVGAATYALSHFVRGIGGEEHLAQRALAAGAPVVLLDAAVRPLATGTASLGATQTYRVGPANRDPSDLSYVTITAAVSGKALTPLAPVHAAMQQTASGIVLRWTRRSRVDGDAWGAVDIPIGESSEAYTVSIARPGQAARILSTTTPAVLYAAADIAADFTLSPTFLDVAIQQISTTVGPGFPLSTRVTFG